MGSSIISHWLPAHLACPPKGPPCEGLCINPTLAFAQMEDGQSEKQVQKQRVQKMPQEVSAEREGDLRSK